MEKAYGDSDTCTLLRPCDAMKKKRETARRTPARPCPSPGGGPILKVSGNRLWR